MNKLGAMPVLQPVRIPTKDMGWFKSMGRWLFGTRKWMFAEDWYYELEDDILVHIPQGFIIDGASIPKIFWSLLSPTGILLIPGCIHDFAYQYGFLWMREVNGQLIKFGAKKKRKYWDRMFRDIAIRTNGFKVINRSAYYALRAGGWHTWRKYRKADKVLEVKV